MSMFQNPKKRASRRAWPIHGYVGPNGGGKSAAMVWDTMPTLAAGRMVLSTVRLLDWERPRDCPGCDEPGHEQWRRVPREEYLTALHTGEDVSDWLPGEKYEDVFTGLHKAAHPCYEKLTDWDQLLNARDCDVLLDEVTGVASSRESHGMPAPIANKLVQLRRSDVVVRFSAPAWARADKIVRETAQAVTFCQGLMPKHSGDLDRLWRQRRLFHWKTYDATLFEDFTAGKTETLPTLTNDWHWGPRSPVFRAYDTYDAVSVVGTVSDVGTCMHCGGSRRRPACKCPDNHVHGSDQVEATRRRVGPRVRGDAPQVAVPRRPVPVAVGIGTPELIG